MENQSYTAFDGADLFAQGPLKEVALKAKARANGSGRYAEVRLGVVGLVSESGNAAKIGWRRVGKAAVGVQRKCSVRGAADQRGGG